MKRTIAKDTNTTGTKKWWGVRWESFGTCLVTSSISPEDAKKRASVYFSGYPASTKYRLIECVETTTLLDEFSVNKSGVLVKTPKARQRK